MEGADREAKSLLRDQALAEDCDRRVTELLANNEALGTAEACRVNLAAARQKLADLAGAQPQIILLAAIRDNELWANRAADFMREVEAAALAAAPTQPAPPTGLPAPGLDEAMGQPEEDDDVAGYALAKGVDLATLSPAASDLARAGIIAQLGMGRVRSRTRSRSRGL